MVRLSTAGMNPRVQTVAELGPGDSLGIGLAALLTGVDSYYGLDALPYTGNASNLAIFEQLIELFQKRSPIPGPDEFREVRPPLDSYAFPHQILDDSWLSESLRPERLQRIRDDLQQINNLERPGKIRFFAPWNSLNLLQPEGVDLIYSQAVMEHVMDIDTTYDMMNRWLKPGGYLSHAIDYRSHHTSPYWNGHWAYSDFAWKLVVGKRVYLLNRQPHSAHIQNIQKHGLEIVVNDPVVNHTGLPREKLSKRFQTLSEADATTSGSFIIAKKPVRN